MTALHCRQNTIRAALYRQMQKIIELGYVGIRLDQAVAEVERVRGGEAYSLDAVDRGYEMNQRRQIRKRAVRHRPGIGIHVLAEQRYLAHALLAQAFHFLKHLLEGTADFFAARIGDDAEATVLAAAFHDRNECGGARRAGRRQSVEFFDFRKTDVDLRPAGFLQSPEHGRQAAPGLGAEHQIDERRARRDALALLTGDAAADADNHVWTLLLEQPPFAQQGEHFLLSLFANRAGIDQQHVRLRRIVGRGHAVGGLEHVPHLPGIVLIHLTAEGFYV